MMWDAKQDAELSRLWAKGMSTAKIGRAMNLTKNSVIGRAHRLKLEMRKSPIEEPGTGRAARKSRAKRAPKITLEPLASAEALMTRIAIHRNHTQRTPLQAVRYVAPQVTSWERFETRKHEWSDPGFLDATPRHVEQELVEEKPVVLAIKAWDRPRTACMSPSGKKPVQFLCDSISLPGKSYCAEHCAKYYQPIGSGVFLRPPTNFRMYGSGV